ncbi:Hypothetical protein CINCED_3A005843 [Cinara cedri]|uniref:Ubiquitin-like-conjugating enzyme ATG10 n=1 Tax=Cinara cedri TaxID=506608 RepID=A0A5E4M9A3_9HEMI|nr:Hypothetical protein CINCED_3A005843 [Cinara cedri]
MSLTYKEFIDYALDFKNHSDSIDDDWNICEHKNPMNGSTVIYLAKKKMQTFKKTSLNSNQSEFQGEKNIYPVMCEYHILYNSSYSCPDMFFNMWYTDGKLLSLEDIWSMVHSIFKQNIEHDKWNFITQKVFYFLIAISEYTLVRIHMF